MGVSVRPRLLVLLSLALVGLSVSAYGQVPLSASTYRVFLKDGRALASYGDAARVGDRIIFNLPVVTKRTDSSSSSSGADGQMPESEPFTLQLMSLPVAVVDLERTERYAETMRAKQYAETRGEADFAALTAAVTSNLGLLTGMDDRKRQLTLAEDVRDQVQRWPRTHFHYRARDVQELVGLFSDVINELRIATGAGVSLDLTSGPIEPAREPLFGAPTPAESVELALTAAEVADVGEERLAILRTTLAALADASPSVRQAVARRLDVEVKAGAAYGALAAEFRKRADAAVKSGSEAAVEQLQAELLKRDQQLGFRRPADVASLMEELDGRRDAARLRRATLDRHAALQRSFLGYERLIRPAFNGLDGLAGVLKQIRDMKPLAFEGLAGARTRLDRLQERAQLIAPPADLVNVHATLMSALAMAREACTRRQQGSVTTKSQVLSEASAAAAGALMLVDRARQDLVETLFPPRAE
jgi:hypothetical protein